MQRVSDTFARHGARLGAVAAVGLVTFAITLVYAPQRAWANLLLGNFYFVSIALYGTTFVALNYVLSGRWAVVFRRAPEAMSAYLPIGAVLMLALFFGHSHLYPWARPEVLAGDLGVQHKAAYLNTPFFFARMAVVFGIWIFFSHLLRRHSRRQDADGDLAHTRRNQATSAGFLLAATATFIFSSIDWIMSLEPHWFSAIFPIYCGGGLLLGGTAALGILLVWSRRNELMPGVTDHHVYEVSRLICATSTLWAYLWFSQYMLIYYANIPEEAVYFTRRLTDGWALLFWLNAVLNWLIPLAILIPASTRRSSRWLLRACAIVLVGRWLDTYLLIMPGLGRPPQFGLAEVLIFSGLAALFVLSFLRSFGAAESVPTQDPYLAESMQLRV